MKRIVIAGAMFLTISCHHEPLLPNTCQVNDPLRELGWIKDSVALYSGDITVSQASYRNQTVFSIESFIGIDAAARTLYDCAGSVICKSYVTIAGVSGSCKTIDEELLNQVVIYKKNR